jgi:hypothetical protein
MILYGRTDAGAREDFGPIINLVKLRFKRDDVANRLATSFGIPESRPFDQFFRIRGVGPFAEGPCRVRLSPL